MCTGGSKKVQKTPQPYRNDPDVQSYYNDPGTGDSDAVWNAWEEAYYMYQKDQTAMQYDAQINSQQAYMEMQAGMAESQLAMQERLQNEQLSAQDRLQSMQAEMAAQQMAFQKEIEAQRVAFEKDAQLMERDSKRAMDQAEDKSEAQARFQAGRDAKSRKNAGGALATKGTKALQVGLTAADAGTAGLAIPT